jgi:DNA-binding protein HU-beta
MNKTQLVEALTERLGDRRTAAAAVDGLLATIVDKVRSGESVTLTGFGVFEGRARAARTARNPRTGAAVAVPATTVPAFRPGAGFRAAVGGAARPSAPAPVAAEPAVEAPAKRGKATNGKAVKSKDAKATDTKVKSVKDRGKAKDGKSKKAKSKK